jgi:hypothetical protein
MHANARGGESMWSGEAGDESIENDGWEIDGLVDGLVDGSMDGAMDGGTYWAMEDE